MKSYTTPTDRVFGLDVFRAVAILMVVLVHGGWLLENTRMNNFPFFKLIDGVDLFFVLSGFLIGGILLKEINKSETFGMKETFHFWKRRWFRTLPAYFLILILNYLFVKNEIIIEKIEQFNWKFFFFLQNFNAPFYDFFWESWSLSVEEWFYLFTPVLLLVLLTFLKPKISFLIVTLTMIVFPIVWRYLSIDPALDGFWFDVGIRKVVLMRLDSIAYGLLGAWLLYYHADLWKKIKWPAFFIGAAIIVFVVNYPKDSSLFYKYVIYFSLLPFGILLLLPVFSAIKTASGIIARFVVHISKISYSMYLINLALVSEVIRDNFPPSDNTDRYIKYLLYWSAVILISTLIYYCYEKPMMNLREKKWLN